MSASEEELRQRLMVAGDQLARAEFDRKQAMTKVRSAVREARDVVPIKQIAEIVGITRPTVYKILEAE